MSDIDFPGERGQRSDAEEKLVQNIHNAANDWPLDDDLAAVAMTLIDNR